MKIERNSMPKIEVSLFATMGKYHPGGGKSDPFQMGMPDKSTLGDLLNKLEIPTHVSKLYYINNRRQEVDYMLQDGDRVAVFPPMAGG